MHASARRRFTFVDCLGRGGFGEVYRAVVASPGGLRSVAAVKVLRADLAIDADAVRRLRDEGRLLARLNHPTILKVFDLVEIEGRVGLVAEYVEGADLAEMVRGEEPMPVRALLQVIGAVAAALDAAWATPGQDGLPLKLVHRDIKPTNIRVGRHGEVKLLDFGIAHFQSGEREARTASDVVVGTLPYMAPERFLEREVRSASDVFALGCSLYEGLVGERWFGGGQLRRLGGLAIDPELYAEHATGRLALVGAHVPEAAAQLLVEMIDHDHRARPSAAEVAARCDRLAEDLTGPTLRRWCRERDWRPAPREEGSLLGRAVTEGTLEAQAVPPSTSRGPVVLSAPLLTIDPGHDLPAAPRRGGPRAPSPRREEARSVDKTVPSRMFVLAGCGAAGLAILLAVSGLIAFIALLALFASS